MNLMASAWRPAPCTPGSGENLPFQTMPSTGLKVELAAFAADRISG
jgi:hypothetical protein